MHSNKEIVFQFLNLFVINFIVGTGVFGTILRIKSVWKILTLFQEVIISIFLNLKVNLMPRIILLQIDELLMVKNSERSRKNIIKELNIILIFLIVFFITNLCIDDSGLVLNYIPYYFLYFIVFIFEYQYWFLIQSVGNLFDSLVEFMVENLQFPSHSLIYCNEFNENAFVLDKEIKNNNFFSETKFISQSKGKCVT